MAYYSLVRYIGDGSNRTFTVPFSYIAPIDVEVYVDGIEVTYTWLTTSTIQLTTAPALATTITVKRNTSKDSKMVDYNNGSILDEQALDRQTDQLMYIAQENADVATDSLVIGADGALDMQGRVVSNAGDPVAADDLVTLGYITSNLNSAVATATSDAVAAKDAAIVAKVAAELAEVNAETAEAGAVVAKDAAIVAKGLAEDAEAAAVAAAASVPTLPLNGATALTDNSIPLSKFSRTGTAGQVLTSGGAGADPSYKDIPASTVFASSAENAAGTIENKAVDPLGIREALNATGTAPVYACRAWVNFNGTGTVAIRASGNVSSITDNGVGDYTVNFTTAMPDANYSVAGVVKESDSTSNSSTRLMPAKQALTATYSTAFVRVHATIDGGGSVDAISVNVSVYR